MMMMMDADADAELENAADIDTGDDERDVDAAAVEHGDDSFGHPDWSSKILLCRLCPPSTPTSLPPLTSDYFCS